MARGSGAVVLLLAILVVAVGARNSRGVDGVAAAIPVSGPPAVGDCATEPVQEYPGYGGSAGTYAYPQLAIAPCTGARFAEVVAVFTDPVQPDLTVEGSALNIVDANQNRCAAVVVAYVGQRLTGDPQGLLWYPVGWWQASLSRPSARQEAAGQHWVACLGSARGPSGSEAAGRPYDGSLRDSMITGVARDRTGACLPGTDLTVGSAPGGCLRPHTLQLLAVASVPPGVDRGTVDQGCAWTAARLTGRPDIATGGSLVVRTQIVGPDGAAAPDGSVPAAGTALCGVSTVWGQTLSGGLGAIGDAPLPWT